MPHLIKAKNNNKGGSSSGGGSRKRPWICPAGWKNEEGWEVRLAHTTRCDICNDHCTDENPTRRCISCKRHLCWICEQKPDIGLRCRCTVEAVKAKARQASKEMSMNMGNETAKQNMVEAKDHADAAIRKPIAVIECGMSHGGANDINVSNMMQTGDTSVSHGLPNVDKEMAAGAEALIALSRAKPRQPESTLFLPTEAHWRPNTKAIVEDQKPQQSNDFSAETSYSEKGIAEEGETGGIAQVRCNDRKRKVRFDMDSAYDSAVAISNANTGGMSVVDNTKQEKGIRLNKIVETFQPQTLGKASSLGEVGHAEGSDDDNDDDGGWRVFKRRRTVSKPSSQPMQRSKKFFPRSDEHKLQSSMSNRTPIKDRAIGSDASQEQATEQEVLCFFNSSLDILTRLFRTLPAEKLELLERLKVLTEEYKQITLGAAQGMAVPR